MGQWSLLFPPAAVYAAREGTVYREERDLHGRGQPAGEVSWQAVCSLAPIVWARRWAGEQCALWRQLFGHAGELVSSVLFGANCLGKQVSWWAVCSLAPIVWASRWAGEQCALWRQLFGQAGELASSVLFGANCLGTQVSVCQHGLIGNLCAASNASYLLLDCDRHGSGLGKVQLPPSPPASCGLWSARRLFFHGRIMCAIPAPCVRFLHHVCNSCTMRAIPAPCVQIPPKSRHWQRW